MEYFIISEGYLWDTVLEILKEKRPPVWMCG